MRYLLPARVPVHKARKVLLSPHHEELEAEKKEMDIGKTSLYQRISRRSKFKTPDFEKLYPAEVVL